MTEKQLTAPVYSDWLVASNKMLRAENESLRRERDAALLDEHTAVRDIVRRFYPHLTDAEIDACLHYAVRAVKALRAKP